MTCRTMQYRQQPPSPHVHRIRLMWQTMRDQVLSVFPAGPGLPRDARTYLKAVYDIYVNDAYHSLSIESYRVSRERNDYMAALESASVRQDIRPFAEFVSKLVDAGLRDQDGL